MMLSKSKVYIFDLDDTLYDESTYVRSGLSAVAVYLEKEFCISQRKTLFVMLRELKQNGRGKVFDETLSHFGLYSKKNVRACLTAYRLHIPKIRLYPDALTFLKKAKKDHACYVVTDGNKVVQGNKFDSLGLKKYITKEFITHRYGKKHAKPSSYCFLRICLLEKINPSQAVYFGDDPTKDFVQLKPLGFKTVRLLRGRMKDVKLSKENEADIKIRSFKELS